MNLKPTNYRTNINDFMGSIEFYGVSDILAEITILFSSLGTLEAKNTVNPTTEVTTQRLLNSKCLDMA